MALREIVGLTWRCWYQGNSTLDAPGGFEAPLKEFVPSGRKGGGRKSKEGVKEQDTWGWGRGDGGVVSSQLWREGTFSDVPT